MPTATPLLPKPPTKPGGSGGPSRLDRSKLLGTRRGAILVAGVSGLAALIVLLIFMANFRHSVRSGSESVHVLVASRQLDAGTPGEAIAEAGLYRTVQVHGDEAAGGALSSVNSLRGKHATATIYQGQQLTAADFASGADPVTGKLAGTERALSVPIDTARGNIGQIHDGSKVDVLGGFNAEESGGRAVPVLDILARNAMVLSAPREASGTGVGASNKEQAVVLRLTDSEAARVAFAAEHGNVWLAIRPPTLAQDSKVNAVGANSLLGAGR